MGRNATTKEIEDCRIHGTKFVLIRLPDELRQVLSYLSWKP